MAVYQISNERIGIEVSTHGAELIRLWGSVSGREYLYDAQPKYWARHSPVLFPIVGSLKDKGYTYRGIQYRMGQHGFARDSEFTLIKKTDDTLVFELRDSEETRRDYPFAFILRCGFTLAEETVRVSWEVKNPEGEDGEQLYFSIGGHPAFFCRVGSGDDGSCDRIIVGDDRAGSFAYYQIGKDGLAAPDKVYHMDADFPALAQTFTNDALIVGGAQTGTLALADPSGEAYVRLRFNAPIFGIWTPVKNIEDPAPFVCLEPWYGRCDRGDFEGDFTQRDYMYELSPQESFEAGYTIELPLEKGSCGLDGIC